MDPLSALGLAVNIFAVIDFSKTAYETLGEIKTSGTIQSVADLKVLSQYLKSYCDIVSKWDCKESNPSPSHRQALLSVQDLAGQTTKIAATLLHELEKLTVEQNAPFITRIRTLAKTMWKHGEIEDIVMRLEKMRDQLGHHVSILTHEEIKIEFSKTATLQALDDRTRSIVEVVLDSKQDLVTAIDSKLEEMKRVLSQSQDAHHESILNKITSGLYFDGIDVFSETINARCENTFEWIYEASDDESARWPTLIDWLGADTSGLYWISGKAGSGKSTLMKFLSQDPRTTAALKCWADGKPVLIASFYASKTGVPLEKSQEGLFRAVLYHALKENPELGPILFPGKYESDMGWEEFPAPDQLKQTFCRLARDYMPMKIALIIDGLDEFELDDADMHELVDLLKDTTETPNCKAILSSRPLQMFENVFRRTPKLRLDELARQDFAAYVNNILASNSQMTKLAKRHPVEAEEMIASIAGNKNAVFLGVKMIVKSVIEGLRGYEPIQELQARVQELPKEVAYQNEVFADGTTFHAEDDGVWTFADLTGNGSPDLAYIKTRKTGTGRIEVHGASRESGFKHHFLATGTAFSVEDNGTWLLRDWTGDGKADLVYIKTRNTGSARIEVHVATAASRYQHFALHTATWFSQEENGTWTMNSKGDLVYIKTKKTREGTIEYYVATKSLNYQSVSQKTITDFTPEENGTWCFAHKANGEFEDLYYIKTRSTSTGTTEVHGFSGESKWKKRLSDVGTSFAPEDDGRWVMAHCSGQPQPDLVYIKTSKTDTGKIEVYINSY